MFMPGSFVADVLESQHRCSPLWITDALWITTYLWITLEKHEIATSCIEVVEYRTVIVIHIRVLW